jgi:Fe2+ or Zn2+ uptake regulation protein
MSDIANANKLHYTFFMQSSLYIQQLKNKGHRITKAREAIIDMFVLHASPVTAKQIEDYLLKRSIEVNKATIYREITFLSKEHIISEVYLSPNMLFYELSDRSHHHHVICITCGRIEDIHVNKEENLIDVIEKKTNYKMAGHLMEFYGTCHNCNR